MNKYEPQKFITALTQKLDNKITCQFCGGHSFISTKDFVSIQLGNEMYGSAPTQNIPSGILVCQNCGHIELFALGILDLINVKEESKRY